MSVSVSLVIPYRPDGGLRAASLEWCLRFWAARLPGAEVVVCDAGGEPFSRAASLNRGAASAIGDLLVLADADTVTDDPAGLLEVAKGGHWVIGHAEGCYWRLPDEASRRLMRVDLAEQLPHPASLGCNDTHRMTSVSGVLAMPRAAFEKVGGLDARFMGWGGEDRAFAWVLDAVWGPHRRTGGHALHLWHPEQGWPDNPCGDDSWTLEARYRAWVERGSPIGELVDGTLPD